jgi:hypothetical protein
MRKCAIMKKPLLLLAAVVGPVLAAEAQQNWELPQLGDPAPSANSNFQNAYETSGAAFARAAWLRLPDSFHIFWSGLVPGVQSAAKRGDYVGVLNLVAAHGQQEQAYFQAHHQLPPRTLAAFARLSRTKALPCLHQLGLTDAQLAQLRSYYRIR